MEVVGDIFLNSGIEAGERWQENHLGSHPEFSLLPLPSCSLREAGSSISTL